MKIILFLLFFVPLTALAADFVQLAPLPTNFPFDQRTLPGYINTIFYLAISVGAVLAVIRITVAGFEMMTSEAVGQIKNSRETITSAVIGLILLLSVTLILSVINPNIVDLSLLNFSQLEGENVPVPNIPKPEDAQPIITVPSGRGLNNRYFGFAETTCAPTIRFTQHTIYVLQGKAPLILCKAENSDVQICCLYQLQKE